MKYLSIILLFLISCQQSVRVENDIINELQVLLNIEGELIQIQNIGKETGTIYDDNILSNINSGTFNIITSGKLIDLRKEDKELFLIDSVNQRFISIDQNSYNLTYEYDLSDFGSPIDLIFPNASNGYFTVEGKDTLFLVDIKFRELVETISIPTGSKPTKLEYYRNRIYVANKGDNTISVIRTNTKSQEAKVQLPAKPIFLEHYIDNEEKLLVVCQTEDKSTCIVFVDLEQMTSSQAYILTDDRDFGENQPRGLAITNSESDYAYIGTDKGVYRADLRSEGLVRFVSFRQENIFDIKYNERDDELMLLTEISGTKYIRTVRALSFTTLSNIIVPPNSSFIFPLYQ